MKSRRTKALAIPPKVKEKVWERDGECCVLCQQWVKMFFANAHFISRAQLGMGIEENIITLCQACHDKYDKTVERPLIREALRRYLKSKYPKWDEQSLYYKKYGGQDAKAIYYRSAYGRSGTTRNSKRHIRMLIHCRSRPEIPCERGNGHRLLSGKRMAAAR